ncbi:hypothetical protein Ahy_A07g035181 [Arachis hypogaea]|uniref:Uncharacterized protein n=1 Tax=Arachis hypogaea TaxID=3818 RepID=A0A445CDE7_ARAHY|nr:hypothetical protein Ahy_A07g035181 [Arachis hypogaea]
MVKDHDFNIKIVGSEITRENDGLAMSSPKSAAADGQVHCEKLRNLVVQCITKAGGQIDYAEIVDQENLEKVEFINGSPVVLNNAVRILEQQLQNHIFQYSETLWRIILKMIMKIKLFIIVVYGLRWTNIENGYMYEY